MMTAAELRLRQIHRRRWVIAIGLVVFLVLLGILAVRPVRHQIKAWQARRHAHKAFALIEAEKWVEARDEALAAYQLEPAEPEGLRAVARFLSRTRQREAFEFWNKLEDRHLLTRQDRRDEAEVALASGNTAVASAAVNDLLTRKDSPAGPPDWLLAAQQATQKSANEEAHTFARKILDDPRAEERLQLQAALIILSTAVPNASSNALTDEAWTRMKKIAHGTRKTALEALLVLAQHTLSLPAGTTEVTGLALPDLVHSLEVHPLATTSHKLLALDLQIHADNSQRPALIDRAIEQWKNGDVPSLVALATWLNGKGEYQRQLDVIPLQKTLQAKDLFLQHVDALGAVGRWDDIRHLLETSRYPLDPVIEHMYLARCYAQLEQKTASDNNWQRALEAAAGDAEKLMMIGAYAEKNGATAIAESAYNSAAQQAPKSRPVQQSRLRLAQGARDTRKMRDILTEMLANWPNEPAIENDEAYIRLLLLPNDPSNPELIRIEKLAETLVQREPSSLPHRTLLALARLKQGRQVAALEVYAGIQTSSKALSASALAVHAAVLAANGHSEDAQTEIKQAPADSLLPEERQLNSP